MITTRFRKRGLCCFALLAFLFGIYTCLWLLPNINYEKDPVLLETQRATRWSSQIAADFQSNYKEILGTSLKQATEKKNILVWYPPFGNQQNYMVSSEECGNCDITYDRSKIKDNSTAAVLFHFVEITPDSMPTARNYDQLHIFWVMEPPTALRLRKITLDFEGKYDFNATMSHRRDSDFQSFYGSVSSRKSFLSDALGEDLGRILKLKSQTALTLVSNCDTLPGAVTRLQKLKDVIALGFKLEAHGKCFPENGDFPTENGLVEEIKKYKFYFAFENSYHCKDYITEKFFVSALRGMTIPVVWGPTRGDYEQAAPQGSFIHADDFPSIKDLVEYLEYLDKNDTAYLEYFRWYSLGENEMPLYGRRTDFCQICRAVHGINVDDIYNPIQSSRPLFPKEMSRRNVPSLKQWLFDKENPECLNM